MLFEGRHQEKPYLLQEKPNKVRSNHLPIVFFPPGHGRKEMEEVETTVAEQRSPCEELLPAPVKKVVDPLPPHGRNLNGSIYQDALCGWARQ